MPRKMTTTQLDLFPDTRSAPATQTPLWQNLPDDTRQTLTRLMAKHAGAKDRGGAIMKHKKIGPQHLERKAILYVRQSSAHQVLHNRESSALQYAMRERLADLGWSRIETVDDHRGRSAAGVSRGKALTG